MRSDDHAAAQDDDYAVILLGTATELTQGEVNGFRPEGGVIPPYVRYPDP